MAHVLCYGPGDLGECIIYELVTSLTAEDRLTIAGRPGEIFQDIVHMAQMKARALNPGLLVDALPWTLAENGQWEDWLRLNAPEVVIFTASYWTWWKRPALDPSVADAVKAAGFGLWLPFQAALLMRFAEYLRSLPTPPWLVIGPYPDVTSVLLKARGFDRTVGFGNVDELAFLYQEEVRLVAHHSVEAALFAGSPLPPYRLWRHEEQGGWEPDVLTRPFAWPVGTRSHVWTAASAVRTVKALLNDTPTLMHAPGPLGLPGGYPVWIARSGIRLALPEDLTLEEAIAINIQAGKADGIDAIDETGRVFLTETAIRGAHALWGESLRVWGPTWQDWDETAQRLLSHMKGAR